MLRNKPQTKRRWLDLAPGDPVIVSSCSVAASRMRASDLASPTPMFTLILSSRGACIGVA